ncbi:type 4 pilus major pilin [Burkholderia sp. WAC0059]|uniref:type 4 pilus major pilin n=1 Tax=Burkholderia sp. WAC0059 TaxID=2066022 RepID=UPI0015E13C6A|nr:type 4 pilus major pilin [Burkholderia sp. WAC0059]
MSGSTRPRRAAPRTPVRQRGATLLEAVAFLGVAAIVALGVTALLSSSFGSAEGIRLTGEVQTIENNVRDLYAGQDGYTNLSMTSLINANAFPQTMAVSDGTVINHWGGTVTVSYTDSSPQISFTSVPVNACVRALTSGVGDWTGISVNGTSLGTLTPSLTQAENACNQTMTGNQITWTFQ